MSAAARERTPVNLLTGFLGSGKTTLLRRLLLDPALANAAVLINEFGEIGLDHHLLERIDETTVLLQSGCLCCTIRGELSDAMLDLERRRARGDIPAFDRLAIESTGLADPFPILSTIRAHPVLRHQFALGTVVATVDAVNAPAGLPGRVEMLKQIAAADRIVVTKTDLVRPCDTASLVERLARLNPTAAICDVNDARWTVGWLMIEHAETSTEPSAGVDVRLDPPGADGDPAHLHHHHGHDRNRHGETIASFAITVGPAIDWTAFGVWLTLLLHRHGAKVLRIKGILNVAGEDNPVAVHGVQHLVHPPVHMSRWPDDDRRSRLVFIVDGLDPDRIRASFTSFCLPQARGEVAS